MFSIHLTYTATLEPVDALLEEHVAYLDEHYESGHFLASGRRVPRTGGVILARAESRDALDAILRRDPFFREGLADYDVAEFVPTKVAPGLEALRDDH